MKKLTKVLLCVMLCAIALCSVSVLVACDNEPAHTHEWAADFTIDKAATCAAEGSKSIHCNGCDETKDVTVIPAIGHVWADDYTVDVEPTCTEQGSKSKHCTVDGCDGKGDVTAIPAIGHVWADEYTIDLEPTCTEEGSKSKHCTVDGCNGKNDVTVIAASGHVWADDYTVDVEPTCTTEGSKSLHCTVDGCNGKDSVAIPANGHSWAEDYTIDLAPTCAEEGSKSKHCTVDGCNGKDDVTVIPANGHSWADEYTVDLEPTCTEEGSKSKHCTVDGCNAKDDVTVIEATGHNATAYPETQSTCSVNGHDAYWQCQACDKYFSDEACENLIDEPVEHVLAAHTYDLIFSQESQKAATCTEDGYRAHNVCTVCHAKFDVNDTALANPISDEDWAANYVLPANHTSVSKKTVKEPTCTLDGCSTEHYYCSKCRTYAWDEAFTQLMTADDVTSVTIAKLGHDYSDEWTIDVESTCAKAGSQSHHCSRCTAKADATAIPALPHSWNESEYVVDLEPTCVAVGSKSYHCSVCGASNAESAVEVPIAPDSHAWSHRSFILTPATCVSEGSQAKMCLICGVQQAPTVIPVNPNAHNYSIWWTVDEEATCTEAGSKSHHCLSDGCDGKGSVTEIPALGHYYEWTVDGTSVTATCVNGCNDVKNYTLPDEASGKAVNNIVEANASGGHFEICSGSNLIVATQNVHYLDFVADKSGTYTFAFEYLSTESQLLIQNIYKDSTSVKTQATITYVSTTRSNVVSIQINALEGETLSLYLSANTTKYSNYMLTVSLDNEITDKSLTDGENTVSVTVSGDLTGIDSYTFTPTESKKYSITVPEGLNVAMNGQDLLSNGTYAEFDATKGKAITLSFTHSEIGDYQIHIGEAAPQILELGANAMSVTIKGHTMTEIHVADDLAPGKYTITFTGNFTFSRITGAGKLWLQLNGDNDFDSLSDDTALYLQSNAKIDKEGYECNLSGQTWTITLELAAGDIIYLAPDASFTAGQAVGATLNIQLTQAA